MLEKFIFWVISILVLIATAFAIVGYTSNPEHQESTQFLVDSNVGFVWQELVNIKNTPQKKDDVESVEMVGQNGTLISWQENLKNGGYRLYRMNEYELNQKLVIELLESSYGLTGVWIFELSPDGNGTQVKISETSTLTNIQKRSIRAIFGRNYDLLVWLKYIKVGVVQNLLKTP